MALILIVTRRLGEGERLVRSRDRWAWDMFFLLGTGIQGKTLGIVGLGSIGTAVARRARAFGMEISYTGPPPRSFRARGGARRSLPPAARAARGCRRRLAPLPPDRRDARADRRRRDRAVEADRVPDQHGARGGRRRGRPRRGSPRRDNRGRGLDVYEQRAASSIAGLLGLENVAPSPPPRLGDARDAHGDGATRGAERTARRRRSRGHWSRHRPRSPPREETGLIPVSLSRFAASHYAPGGRVR